MTFREPTPSRRIASLALLVVLQLSLAACASAPAGPGPVRRSERFPLDPREELDGPFPEGVETGWRALAAGDAAVAEAEFLRARGTRPFLAAEIGLIESRVLLGKVEPALAGCRDALGGGTVTVPLLVACGEARARADQIFEAHELYARAAARASGRRAIRTRAEELRREAVRSLAKTASAAKDPADARQRIERAIELDPSDAELHALAAEIELASGQSDRAFERYREAHRLDPKNVPVQEHLAELALDRDPALAVSVLDGLARRDPRYRDRLAAARLAFRISNWPEPEREAARSERLTRAGAATLIWWMFPQIREAKVATSVIASDVVSRRDSRAVMRAVSLGLLEVDRDTHRARPDAGLTRRAAARMMLRLLNIVQPPGNRPRCLDTPVEGKSPENVRSAIACGLLEDREESAVGGPEITRGLDRLRVLATGKGEEG